MLSLSLRQLEYVVAVARFEGVSAAAAALNVSQPSISVAIAQVEREIGKTLFVRRKGNAAVPTSNGRAFVDEARRLLNEFAQLTNPDGAPWARPGPCTIGFFVDLAPMLLAPILGMLEKQFPDAPVAVRVGGFEAVREDLDRGRIDFALSYDLGFEARFARRPVAALRPHAIVSRKHRLARRTSISLAELAQEPLILADQGLSIEHIQTLFTRRGLAPRISHRAASLEVMRSFAGNGMGVAISYTRSRSNVSADGKPIRTIEISEAEPQPIAIIASDSNPPTRSIRRLIDCIAARGCELLLDQSR